MNSLNDREYGTSNPHLEAVLRMGGELMGMDPAADRGVPLGMTNKMMGLGNSLNDQGFYREDVPNWLNYFAHDWLRKQPGTPMAYTEPPRTNEPDDRGGWQPGVSGIKNWEEPSQTLNYNTALAYLNNMQPAIQWEDQGPAGARWHGYSKTPGGQDLKAPWHPSAYHEDMALMEQLLQQALQRY
jgi:hypothetical protein